MSWLSDAYDWVDTQLASGLLPGGVSPQQSASPLGLLASQLPVVQAPAAQPTIAIGAPGLASGGLFAGGVVQQAASGFAVTAPRPNGAVAARGRGRTVTAVATVYEDGSIVPRRMMPGSPVAMSSDLAAVRRLKSAKARICKAVPSMRASKRPKC